jgi:hypothetical protein
VVLVVDDEPCVLNTVSCILEYAGYQVLTADSAPGALRLAAERREPVDLLLTDVVLGAMSGTALAEEFSRRHPETRMLFMAGLPDNPDIRDRVIGRGRAFLPKPFRAPVLLEAVSKALETPQTRTAGTAL